MAIFPTGQLLSTLSEAPAQEAAAVTPNDTTAVLFRSVYIGGAGDLVVTMVRDSAPVTFSGTLAGTILPLAVRLIHSTGTTATNIVGLG